MRWRNAEYENLGPPPPPPPEPGKRRSARARAGTQFFSPTLAGPAKHARCTLHSQASAMPQQLPPADAHCTLQDGIHPMMQVQALCS